jgi:hypothetical protein
MPRCAATEVDWRRAPPTRRLWRSLSLEPEEEDTLVEIEAGTSLYRLGMMLANERRSLPAVLKKIWDKWRKLNEAREQVAEVHEWRQRNEAMGVGAVSAAGAWHRGDRG